MKILTLVAVTLAAVAVAGLAASGKTIRITDLPAAVQKAVRQQEAGGATVKNVVAEGARGKTLYEVEMMLNGRTRDLIFDATGTVVESEDEVSIDAVPAPVKAALEARGKVMKVETLTKGTQVTYEAQIWKNGKKSEVAVDAAGKRVKG